jgi:hypothetical protein
MNIPREFIQELAENIVDYFYDVSIGDITVDIERINDLVTNSITFFLYEK